MSFLGKYLFSLFFLFFGGIPFKSAGMSLQTPHLKFTLYSKEMKVDQESVTIGLLKDLMA